MRFYITQAFLFHLSLQLHVMNGHSDSWKNETERGRFAEVGPRVKSGWAIFTFLCKKRCATSCLIISNQESVINSTVPPNLAVVWLSWFGLPHLLLFAEGVRDLRQVSTEIVHLISLQTQKSKISTCFQSWNLSILTKWLSQDINPQRLSIGNSADTSWQRSRFKPLILVIENRGIEESVRPNWIIREVLCSTIRALKR